MIIKIKINLLRGQPTYTDLKANFNCFSIEYHNMNPLLASGFMEKKLGKIISRINMAVFPIIANVR